MEDEGLRSRLAEVEERIARAAAISGRSREDVRLLLATKTVPAERIRLALEAGFTLIAENRVQELVEKAPALSNTPHESHFIGNLQRNKVNQILKLVTCVQSVDRISLARAISDRVGPTNPMDVYVQVNTSGEESKFGVTPDVAIAFANEVDELDGVAVKGFMTIGLFSTDEVPVRRCYEKLRQIRDEVVSDPSMVGAAELSMGMSGDLEWAIEEGATMVRVGTAVFGKRDTPDSFYWPAEPIPSGEDR
ncbi:MAG TPA: YggS family pyridoxal phosphate-dependent enzyme [Microthrixaceae bacterium]|nr:YggS family pyridoxal phosphate-dependent enzyme [Microthrixaceae bacterium]